MGCSLFPPHGENSWEFHSREGALSCHLHRVIQVLHRESLGLRADPADLSLAPSPPWQPQDSGNTPLPRERIHFLPMAVLTPVTAWE